MEEEVEGEVWVRTQCVMLRFKGIYQNTLKLSYQEPLPYSPPQPIPH